MPAASKKDRPENKNDGQLRKMQMSFAGHIRDPEAQPAPEGIENRRMQIYRELFFNNVSSMLASNFPVIRTRYSDERWNALIRNFYSEHRCHTPLFPELPKEFLRYLQDGRGERSDDPPFLHELAHYEWVELALSLEERELDEVAADPDGDLLTGIPVLSPLAWPLSYRFPVHRIRPDFQPDEPPGQDTHLLVYRNRSYDVKFMQLNEVSRLLLQLMKEDQGRTGLQLLEEVAAAIGHPQPDKVLESGAELMEDLRRRDILLGTRRTEEQ